MSPVTSTNENKLAQSPPQSQLKMTDIKPELITKAVRKHAGRAKERFLQNLGKADRTTDEVFDDYVHNFTRQQNQSVRLQKEVANYIRCTRAMQAASKSLMDTVYDMYEPDWVERDRLAEQALVLENVWSDYSQKLRARVDEPVEMYASQFPEVRRKVEKRGRKLVDYDSHRHNYEALQNTTKRRDQAKIDRQHQILLEAKQTFESVNSELYDELPALYDSRLPFLVSSMQNLFDIESNFLSGAAKVQQELEILMDRLHKESTSGRYSTRRNSPKSPKSPTAPVPASPTSEDSGTVARSAATAGGTRPYEEIARRNENNKGAAGGNRHSDGAKTNGSSRPSSEQPQQVYDIPVGATRDNLPAGVLYRVKAAYRYQAEDSDELSFEVGEVMDVVEYEDAEDQEEGWLMGVKQDGEQKGMFPANFTRPI